MHGGQVGQRPPLADVDRQLGGVDPGNELAELGAVAADGNPHGPHPAPGILGAGGGGAGEDAAVGGQAGQGGRLLRADGTRLSTTSNRCPATACGSGVAV